MEEIWKPIPDFEDRYLISNLGNVKSLRRKRKFGTRERWIEERVMNKYYFPNGYTFITLSDYPKKSKQIMIHRLVAYAFVENPDKKRYVNHKNGIKDDNRAENLEWVTLTENARHYRDEIRLNEKRKCRGCRKEYEAKKKNQMYCGNSCRGNIRRKSGIDDVKRNCLYCGDAFSAWKYGKHKFCSIRCSRKFAKQNN